MIEKKLKIPIGITIFIGAILKIMDNPYGPIVFTIGFLAFFLFKLVKLFRTKKFLWTNLHYLQLFFIIATIVFLILMYYDYPYSRVGFAFALLFESLVSFKIMITSLIGDSNVKMITSFLGRLIKNR